MHEDPGTPSRRTQHFNTESPRGGGSGGGGGTRPRAQVTQARDGELTYGGERNLRAQQLEIKLGAAEQEVERHCRRADGAEEVAEVRDPNPWLFRRDVRTLGLSEW